MIRIWKQTEGKLLEIEKQERNCWIDVINPSAEDIEILKNEYHVPEDFIFDILDIDERSRTEMEGRWMLIIMRIPVFHPQDETPYHTIPLGVLVSVNMIITICLHPNEVVNSQAFLRIKNFSVENRPDFIMHLLLRSANYFLRYLKEINRITSSIEEELRKSSRNKDLTELMRYDKCLVFFTTSLKSNEILIAKLQNSKVAKNNQIDEDLLEDVIIENRQASEMARVHSDIMGGLMDFFASVISNNLNAVVKQLTSITIILMIPTLVASLFGMNVPNGMERSPLGFWVAIAISFVVSVGGVIVFRRRNLF